MARTRSLWSCDHNGGLSDSVPGRAAWGMVPALVPAPRSPCCRTRCGRVWHSKIWCLSSPVPPGPVESCPVVPDAGVTGPVCVLNLPAQWSCPRGAGQRALANLPPARPFGCEQGPLATSQRDCGHRRSTTGKAGIRPMTPTLSCDDGGWQRLQRRASSPAGCRSAGAVGNVPEFLPGTVPDRVGAPGCSRRSRQEPLVPLPAAFQSTRPVRTQYRWSPEACSESIVAFCDYMNTFSISGMGVSRETSLWVVLLPGPCRIGLLWGWPRTSSRRVRALRPRGSRVGVSMLERLLALPSGPAAGLAELLLPVVAGNGFRSGCERVDPSVSGDAVRSGNGVRSIGEQKGGHRGGIDLPLRTGAASA